jgi:putative sterol carrier protein
LVCDKAKAESAKFVMTGDYSRWKQVALKELDATKALLQGKLKMRAICLCGAEHKDRQQGH